MIKGSRNERAKQVLIKTLELIYTGKCSTVWTTSGFIPTIDVGTDIITICDLLLILPYEFDAKKQTITILK